ncbi:TPA: EAL domain-containing protein [Klebsiella pneumoniae]|nr:EAL domain-containing protein [Klebsiella pneumoniae]
MFRFPSGPHIEWLTVLDFDEIKIDRIFIANIDDPVKRALLVSVVKGLRGTGKPLVFEGVETPGQFEFVRSLGPGGNDSNLLIVFYVQIMPDDFVMQLHRF